MLHVTTTNQRVHTDILYEGVYQVAPNLTQIPCG